MVLLVMAAFWLTAWAFGGEGVMFVGSLVLAFLMGTFWERGREMDRRREEGR